MKETSGELAGKKLAGTSGTSWDVGNLQLWTVRMLGCLGLHASQAFWFRCYALEAGTVVMLYGCVGAGCCCKLSAAPSAAATA